MELSQHFGVFGSFAQTGMRIGEGTEVFARTTDILIDTTRPWLIEIGRNVQLTAGVKILTHGYDWGGIESQVRRYLR